MNLEITGVNAELLYALREMTEDIEARWDMNAPSTNPGIKHCVDRARAAIRKAQLPATADDTIGATVLDWHRAALIAGEHLAPTGPNGYYEFTPSRWLTWVRGRS